MIVTLWHFILRNMVLYVKNLWFNSISLVAVLMVEYMGGNQKRTRGQLGEFPTTFFESKSTISVSISR